MSSAANGERASQVAWVDGALVPRDEARISIDDFGARYGAACFETMLARGGVIFRLDAHLDRLERGLRAMRAAPPAREQLVDAVQRTLAANALSEASVRLSVSAGRGHAPDLASAHEPTVVVTADPLLSPAPSTARPVDLRIVSVRVDARRVLAEAKVAQFLPYLVARAEAREAGADDALLLNHEGAVVEAATANVFVLLDGTLVTPRIEDGPLPGITRAAVLEVARAAAISTEERTVAPAELARADTVFLTSSVQGIVPVASISGGGLDWRADEAPAALDVLRDGYEALIARECQG